MIAVAGDMSDYQYIQKILGDLMLDERAESFSDSHPTMGPEQIYEYLSNVMYHRRSQLNPLWNAMLVGGVKGGER